MEQPAYFRNPTPRKPAPLARRASLGSDTLFVLLIDVMKNLCIVAFIMTASWGVAGCRQADGPQPSSAAANKDDDISDVSKDILNVVAKVPTGPEELAHDLLKFGQAPESAASLTEFSRRLSDVLPSVRLAEPDAQRLAQVLWQGITNRQLSDRQSKALQADVKLALVSAGVSDANATSVASQLGEVQKATTTRKKKWYEIF